MYKKLKGYKCDLQDLAELEPDLARGLQQLLDVVPTAKLGKFYLFDAPILINWLLINITLNFFVR